ncbi:hypothetical protein C0J52_18374 [Blattella germanica]|nr:hypothetical protein C0J52_18374 [Blattella germanica]
MKETKAVSMPSSRTVRSRTVLMWVLMLIVTFSCGVQAAPEAYHHRQGDPTLVIPAPALNDIEELGINENIDDPKLREQLTEMLAILQMYKNKVQQGNEEDPSGLDSGAMVAALEGLSNMPLPASLQAKLFRSQEGVNKEEMKRGSYMSLCHFKICNMGRKRNLRWNPWIRR